MAAYASLVSVMHILEQIKHHPSPPGKMKGIIQSLILDAAYAAEDVIESHIVDCIEPGPTSEGDRAKFGQLLQKVIEDMDLIKNEVVETIEKMGVQHNQPQRKSTSSSGHSTSSSSAMKQEATMVGFDDALLELLDKLTGVGLDRQIIYIVGMGGIGKTTLARNVYEHLLIRESFDILAWATISQEYDARNIIDEILPQAKQDKRSSSEKNESQIGDDLYKYLFGRNYLIVMDDMWSIQAWDKIRLCFPDNNNGSRIVVTTRLSDLARQLNNSTSLHMRFLDLDESWDLFSKIVFPRDGYSLKLVEIGKKIVEHCRGLPLSIVVVGGFLAKSQCKREHWEHVEENLISFVNSDNDQHCFKTLELSYNQLPVHLKPCFLYMRVFKEDSEIHISKLAKLWVAVLVEGFLKNSKWQSLGRGC